MNNHMIDEQILGLHHVTAIASDPQRNLDFYAGVLGLRLVKLTVNFDDPGSYHFYFGDALGSPGTILTFFPWPHAPRGRQGSGQATALAFAVPQGSLSDWRERLGGQGVAVEGPVTRFGEKALAFRDPDGMPLEMVTQTAPNAPAAGPWAGGTVPAEQAISGFHSVTLELEAFERTAPLLTETMGFRATQDDGYRFRFAAGSGEPGMPNDGPGTLVDILCRPTGPRGGSGAGTVHHVAFRTPGDAQQAAWRRALAGLGYNVSPVMDREYFHSIYFREPGGVFREPGGVLFEIATDPPGFGVDEPQDELGTHLMLPGQYEAYRAQIEQALPPLRLPDIGGR